MKIVPACLNDFLKVIDLMKDADDSMSSPKDANIIKWLMCVGNHDLVAMSRRSFFDSFLSNLSTDPSATFAPSDADGNAATLSPRPPLYFDYVCHHPTRAKHSVRLIFLDGYEISVCGAISDRMQEEACAILTAKNKNLSTVPQGNWFAGLADEVCHSCILYHYYYLITILINTTTTTTTTTTALHYTYRIYDKICDGVVF